jgi:hypothetical protein
MAKAAKKSGAKLSHPYRYDAALSDISGQDIEVHDCDPGEAIRGVRNWLSEHRAPNTPPLPGATAMLGDCHSFQTEVGGLLAARRLDSLEQLTHSDFLFIVRTG